MVVKHKDDDGDEDDKETEEECFVGAVDALEIPTLALYSCILLTAFKPNESMTNNNGLFSFFLLLLFFFFLSYKVKSNSAGYRK